MIEPDNPVGRLYIILNAAHSNTNDSAPLRDVLSRVFSVEPGNTSELLYIYLKLLELVKSAKASMQQLPNAKDELHIKPFERLEQGFNQSTLHNNWGHFKTFADPLTMKSLQYCADILSQNQKETIVSQEEISALRSQVEELLVAVMETEIPKDLKQFLIERLEEIRRALLYYQINGSDGLEEALRKILGAIYIFQARNTETSGDKKNGKIRNIVDGFMNVVMKLGEIVKVAKNFKGLLFDNLPPLIGPGV